MNHLRVELLFSVWVFLIKKAVQRDLLIWERAFTVHHRNPESSDQTEYIRITTEEILDLCDKSPSLSDLGLLLYELQFRSPKDQTVKIRMAQVLLRLIPMYSSAQAPVSKPLWPTTNTKNARSSLSRNKHFDWREVGVLKASGYTVGETNGISHSPRIKILNSPC